MSGRVFRILAALFCTVSTPLLAHHSASGFDHSKSATVTGIVREFQWTNPHTYIQIRVKDKAGREQEWSFEMGPPYTLQKHGWKPSTIRPGQTITVTYRPLRNGGKGGLAQHVRDEKGIPFGKDAGEAQ
jgi:hypothetical protein